GQSPGLHQRDEPARVTQRPRGSVEPSLGTIAPRESKRSVEKERDREVVGMQVETLVGKAEHELWLIAHEYPRQLPRRLPLVHACQVAVWEIEALRSRSNQRAP